MNLLNFIAHYPDELSCKVKWKPIRDQEGVLCPRCSCQTHYWKNDKECYECERCRYRQGLKANTLIYGSNLPIRYWFMAMHLLTGVKKSFPALELQRQLGHKRDEPVWYMLHKLRVIMGKRESDYTLSGIIEQA